MQEEFYLNKLYPLQDKILSFLRDLNSDFYLTGGTALSRHYLNHRYSDDLDFFFNRSNAFQSITQQAINLLQGKFELELRVASESYVQIFVKELEVELKIEFVNDVGYRYGVPIIAPLFSRIDTWRNILSNKITALSRQAPKDIVDIIYLSRKFSFNWVEIINEAQQKDSWVNEIEVSQSLHFYAVEKTSAVNWINPPDYQLMNTQLRTISKDILLGADNSLASSR